MTIYKVTQKATPFSCNGKKRKQTALVRASEDTPEEEIREAGLDQISWIRRISQSDSYVRKAEVTEI